MADFMNYNLVGTEQRAKTGRPVGRAAGGRGNTRNLMSDFRHLTSDFPIRLFQRPAGLPAPRPPPDQPTDQQDQERSERRDGDRARVQITGGDASPAELRADQTA